LFWSILMCLHAMQTIPIYIHLQISSIFQVKSIANDMIEDGCQLRSAEPRPASKTFFKVHSNILFSIAKRFLPFRLHKHNILGIIIFISFPNRLPWHANSNCILWNLKIMKNLIMQLQPLNTKQNFEFHEILSSDF
jgi:hypothetical protein